MRVFVDLPEEMDVTEWAALHAQGRVGDRSPYGLHKLARHGIDLSWDKPVPTRALRTFIGKVRGRMNDSDPLSVALTALRHDRRRADAVLCWDERNGVPAALVPGGPPVVTGGVWLADPAAMHPLTRAMTRRALPRIPALFHFCSPMLPIIEKQWGLPAGRVHRITMGTDTEYFTPKPRRPDDPENLVFSVGDDNRRDHPALVRAARKVQERGVDIRLELGTTMDVEIPPELGVVHRERLDHRVHEMFRRCTVVAIAIKKGPGGAGLTAIVEAMACGRPIVVTGNPGLEEYVDHGKTGLLVPPGDDDGFADAVASLLSDQEAAAAMGKAARRAAEERYSTDNTAAELAAVLRATI